MSEDKKNYPDKTFRTICWEAKDKYWNCLDKGGSCEELRKKYIDSCPPTWVKHFDRKREYLRFKEKFYAGEIQDE